MFKKIIKYFKYFELIWSTGWKQKSLAKQIVLEQVFENSEEGSLIIDQSFKFLRANRKFLELTGYQEKELFEKPLNIQCNQTQKNIKEIFKEMRSRWEGEVVFRNKSGEKSFKWLDINQIRNKKTMTQYYFLVLYNILKKKGEREYLEHILNHDRLTGLPNEALLRKTMREWIKQAIKLQHNGLLILLKAKTLKDLNDTLGYQAKNKLLIEIAYRLKNSLSQESCISRLSRNHFLIGIRLIQNKNEAKKITTQLIKNLEFTPFSLHEKQANSKKLKKYQMSLNFQLGLSIFPEDGTHGEILIQNTQTALKNIAQEEKYQFYTKKLRKKQNHWLEMNQELRKAIHKQELVLYYQPRYNLKKGLITSIEGLVRWNHPEKGILLPGFFIPYAEKHGFIQEIGQQVLRMGCWDSKKWQDKGYKKVRLAINVSAKQFQSKNLEIMIDEILQKTKLEYRWLELELTETLLHQNIHLTMDILEKLKRKNIYLSIDDFGTGYSSLSYLKRLPVHALKIDKSFICELPQDFNNRSIIKSIIDLAHNLNLKVIAEGVETKEQNDFLKENQCDEVQGYYLSKVLSPEQMEAQLTKA